MRQEVKLFLGGQEVEFSNPPDILYNYTITDTTNPTVLKNSFSKTLTLDGTPNNNNLFGQIWDLSRIQNYAEGNYCGADFNPLKKAEFILYVNGEVYETGYFKLDEVRKTKNDIQYDITLYGGLGELFFNLSYASRIDDVTQDEVQGPDKKEIADLLFLIHDGWRDGGYIGGSDLDFDINKETINEAWNAIDGGGDSHAKFEVVNFTTAYEGVPSDFGADKIIIPAGLDGLQYGDYPYDLATAPQELTYTEAKDYRSYMMRPVLNVRKVIEACCDPINNGGFDVELDKHFFNNNNPYWSSAWMTLPSLQSLNIEPKSTTKTSATLQREGAATSGVFDVIYDGRTIEEGTNANISVEIGLTSDTSADELFLSHKYETTSKRLGKYIRSIDSYTYIATQLVALDSLGNVVGQSDVIKLSGTYPERSYYANHPVVASSVFKGFKETAPKAPVNNVSNVIGSFKRQSGNRFVFCDTTGRAISLNLSLDKDVKFTKLVLKVIAPTYSIFRDRNRDYNNAYQVVTTNEGFRLWLYTKKNTINDWHEKNIDVVKALDRAPSQNEPSITNFSVATTNYEGFFSNTHIDYRTLLTLGITPCDFLLSYCKLFGLHLLKDPFEKKVTIMDRNSFYDINDVYDLSELIDRGKQIQITPQLPATKWYDFNIAQNESSANNDYKESYNTDYGLQRVNTNYNFDADRTDVFKDNIFRGSIEVLEKDKYYRRMSDRGMQPSIQNGATYQKYTKKATGELEATDMGVVMNGFDTTSEYLNEKNPAYDTLKRPQYHNRNNENTDGSFSLLFLGYSDYSEDGYFITDDIEPMKALNEQACWLMCNDEYAVIDGESVRIAIKRNTIPHFERNITYENGFITHSWDMGTPRSLYVPDEYVTNGMSIYDKCWKNYIGDLYSANDRILKCYCLIKERPNPNWLRRFYYFDNCIWRLNKIIDWNVSSYDTTKMEFIKVQDLYNYTLDAISDAPVMDLSINGVQSTGLEEIDGHKYRLYELDYNVDTVTLNLECQDGGLWMFGDYGEGTIEYRYDDGYVELHDFTPDNDVLTPSTGHGNTQVVFNLGANPHGSGRSFTLAFRIEDGPLRGIKVYQKGNDRLEVSDVIDFDTWEPIDEIPADSEGKDFIIRVDSSLEWEYEAMEDYVKPYYSSDMELWFKVDSNEGAERECNIRISNGKQEHTVVINQKGIDPILKFGNLYRIEDGDRIETDVFDYEEAVYELEINSNVGDDYSLILPDAIKGFTKIDDGIRFTVPYNNEEEKVQYDFIVSKGVMSDYKMIMQDVDDTKDYVVIEAPTLNGMNTFDTYPAAMAEGDFYEILVMASAEWDVKNLPSYVKVVSKTFEWFRYTIDANLSDSEREILIDFYLVDKPAYTATSSLMQDAGFAPIRPFISLDGPYNNVTGNKVEEYPALSIDDVTYTINVSASHNWDVLIPSAVRVVSRNRTTLTYTVSSNMTIAKRMVTLHFYLPDTEGASQELTLPQKNALKPKPLSPL